MTKRTLATGILALALLATPSLARAGVHFSFGIGLPFFGVAPGPAVVVPAPAYVLPPAYYPYPLPPAPSLGFGRGGIYGHVFVGRDESITSYTFPGRDSWQ